MPPSGPRSGSTPPHPLAGTAPDAVLAEEDALRSLLVETVVWFDATGRPIGRKTGQPSMVEFSAPELTTMRDSILTHNHPLGWGYPATDPRRAGNSFSDDDVHFAVAADVAEFRAVTPLLRFSIARPVAGWRAAPREIRLYHAAQKDVAAAELALAIKLGSLTLEEAEASLYHETIRRLSAQLGIRYTRWEG